MTETFGHGGKNDNGQLGNGTNTSSNIPVHVTGSCSIISSITDLSNSSSAIYISPNPSNGIFSIETSKGIFEVYNLLGEKIHSQIIVNKKTEINLSHQSNGIYFLNLKTDKSTYTGKVLIQK